MNKTGFIFILCCLLSSTYSFSQTPAFPGAEGGGMFTTGGRGGDVYYVNTLSDNNEGNKETREGSLRWCINQQGKRIILFKLSGTIWLNEALTIANGDLTIAGQSAPGDGICIAGFPLNVRGDNIIIRYLRCRMGDLVIPKDQMSGADAFGGGKNEDIIIDHCSISWGTDECSSFYDNKNFTMQWCIVSESLRLSGHFKGPHGYGTIWGGVNATFHHNLLAHHDSRTPRFGPGRRFAGTDTVDVRNNVYYNWNGHGAYGCEAMHINIVNNYYKPGPATLGRVAGQIVSIDAKSGDNTGGFDNIRDVWGKYFIEGNYIDGNVAISENNWQGVILNKGKTREELGLEKPLAVTPMLYTHDAHTAYKKVLDYVGCSKSRDELDKRIIHETTTGTAGFYGKSPYNGKGGEWKSIGYPKKGIIDSQSDLKPPSAGDDWSAWPELATRGQITDSDRDGIPDGWLTANYPGKKASDLDDEGYTYLEVYLNDLVKHITENQQ